MAQNKDSQHLPEGLLDEQIPDELHPLLQYMVDNIKPIGLGILAVILVVAAVTGYQYYQKSQIVDASQKLETIMAIQDGDKRIQALEDFTSQAPEAVQPSALFSLADEAMKAKQYKVAASAYKRLADLSDDSTKLVAVMGEASAEMASGNNAEAASLLSSLRSTAPENFQIMIDMQLAQAYEQAGQYQAAINAYQNVLGKAGQESKALFEYRIAKLKNKLEKSNASAS